MSSSEKEPRPALAVALLALLGLFAVPRIVGTGPALPPEREPLIRAPVSSPSRQLDSIPTSSDEHLEILAPLMESISAGDGNAIKDETALLTRLGEKRVLGFRSMVAALPDPINSGIGYRFDDYLDVVQRAIESNDYVLDRYRLPWKGPTAANLGDYSVSLKLPPDSKLLAAGSKLPLDSELRAIGSSTSRDYRGQPGLLVFRRVKTDDQSGEAAAFPRSFSFSWYLRHRPGESIGWRWRQPST